MLIAVIGDSGFFPVVRLRVRVRVWVSVCVKVTFKFVWVVSVVNFPICSVHSLRPSGGACAYVYILHS